MLSLLVVLAPKWKSWGPDGVGTRESQGGALAELPKASLLRGVRRKQVLGVQSFADCVTSSQSLNLSRWHSSPAKWLSSPILNSRPADFWLFNVPLDNPTHTEGSQSQELCACRDQCGNPEPPALGSHPWPRPHIVAAPPKPPAPVSPSSHQGLQSLSPSISQLLLLASLLPCPSQTPGLIPPPLAGQTRTSFALLPSFSPLATRILQAPRFSSIQPPLFAALHQPAGCWGRAGACRVAP